MDWKLFSLRDFPDLRAAVQIAHRRHNRMACARECDSRGEADAAVRSCDHR
jgi:hypothetical protein